MDKFGRTELPLRMKRKTNRIDKAINVLQQKLEDQDRAHKESLKRLAEQLFDWIQIAHTTKPLTMIQGDIIHTKEDYIDWTQVFEGHL